MFSPCVSMILALVSVGQACRLRGEWRAVPRIGVSSTTSNHSLQHEYAGDECRSLVARRRASRGSHSGQSGLSALGTGVRSGPCLVVPCRLIPLTSGKTTASPLTCRSRARCWRWIRSLCLAPALSLPLNKVCPAFVRYRPAPAVPPRLTLTPRELCARCSQLEGGIVRAPPALGAGGGEE